MADREGTAEIMDLESLTHLLETFAIPVVFASVLLEQLGLPIPAVPTMIVGGAVAAQGNSSPLAVLVAAVTAYSIGDSIWYLLGRRYGQRILRLLCRISLTPDYCVRQASLQFERWGAWALLFGKFVPGVSAVISPLAGSVHVPWPRFFLLTSLGSALWASVAVGAGTYFSAQVRELLKVMQELGTIGMLAACILLAAYVALRYWQRYRFLKAIRMLRITADELRALMQREEAPFIVDLRGEPERIRDGRTIPGALALSLDDVDRTRNQFPRDRDIVFYCSCPNEASAATAARTLMRFGFERVRPLLGGLDAWAAAGYEMEVVVERQLMSNV
jgi:membrane protein DedA with SNARE-associated domain/rhodanese-related sulfurtransferase